MGKRTSGEGIGLGFWERPRPQSKHYFESRSWLNLLSCRLSHSASSMNLALRVTFPREAYRSTTSKLELTKANRAEVQRATVTFDEMI